MGFILNPVKIVKCIKLQNLFDGEEKRAGRGNIKKREPSGHLATYLFFMFVKVTLSQSACSADISLICL